MQAPRQIYGGRVFNQDKCRYYIYLTLSNFFPVFLVQTIIRERDDPRFVHESFPGPRGRPSALHVPACMGDGALH